MSQLTNGLSEGNSLTFSINFNSMNFLLFMNFTMNFSQGCFQLQYKYQIYELEYKYYKL